MPHIIVDYSAPLKKEVEAVAFKQNLIETLIANSDFDPKAIKYRSCVYSDYDCASENFIHLNIKMLSGRTLDQKQKLTTSAGAMIHEHFKSQAKSLSISVEIQDIHRESYFKT